MTRGRSPLAGPAVGALAAAVVVAALRFALTPDPASAGVEFLPDMARSPAYASQCEGAPTADGVADRAVPAGTIVRGVQPFRYGPGPDEARRAGTELRNPFAAGDAAAEARGAVVFSRFCTPCHGADGEGRGGAVLRGLLPPPSLLGERARRMPDGEAFHVLTAGQGNMPSYAVQVDAADRWKAVLHMRRLQSGGAR